MDGATDSAKVPPAHPAPSDACSLPVWLWGLSAPFWSCLKLRVATVLTLPPCSSSLPGSYSLAGAPLCRAELLGVVVGVNARSSHVTYEIDDASGVMPCVAWFPKEVTAAAAAGGPAAATTAAALPAIGSGLGSGGVIGSSSSSSFSATHYRVSPSVSGGFASSPVRVLALGCTARVRGRIVEGYEGQRQLRIEAVYVETDPHAELLHWLECAQLFKHVYSQSSPIAQEAALLAQPARLSEAVRAALLAARRSAGTAGAAEAAAATPSGALEPFTLQSLLLRCPELRSLAEQQARELAQRALSASGVSAAASASGSPAPTAEQCLRAAVDYLLQLGQLVRLPGPSEQYELLSVARHLAPLVFRLVADGGGDVPLERIRAGVAAHPHAPVTTVEYALRALVLQSDICAGALPGSYACCNPAAAAGAEPLVLRELAD